MVRVKQHGADRSRKAGPKLTLLGGLSAEQFLKDYWQKRPLLVRGAWPDWHDPLSPDELAGLATEPGVHARLVMERGGRKPWELQHGPLSEKTLRALPRSHWSLLVSNVEQWVEDAALILDQFSFVPHWRADDLMVSFAPPQGSVGPHVDSYDVFLIQGLGERRWGIQEEPDLRWRTGVDLRLLKKFKADSEWVLGPGDMLYLPPGVAHHGVALQPCLTYSVGFRAPVQRDLLGDFYNLPEALSPLVTGDALYADPDLQLQSNPGLITAEAVAKITATLQEPLNHPDLMARWFGAFVTKAGGLSEPTGGRRPPRARLTALLKSQRFLWRSDSLRWAYWLPQQGPVYLFIGGQEEVLQRGMLPLVECLCASRRWRGVDLAAQLPKAGPKREAALEFLASLLARGAVYANS